MVIDPPPPKSAQELPRLMIAAPGSGHGKTTVATGLMGALAAAGRKVAGFKVGPTTSTLATTLARNRPAGTQPRSLPLWRGADGAAVAARRADTGTRRHRDHRRRHGAFRWTDRQRGFASTAHVASLVRAPVIVVIDISHTSRTAAAIMHGLNTFDPHVRLSGVIINKAGSERHAREIVESIQATGLEVLGVLPRDAGIEIPAAPRSGAGCGA